MVVIQSDNLQLGGKYGGNARKEFNTGKQTEIV